ncbi:Uncharacterised protein [Yersinia bercovieri]|nr:Uncharacterised protein [Yersinia bercovieri]
MTIPTLTTKRLCLKPLVAEDAIQIQKLFPRWEIVRYMVASVPWPYPDNGAENYVNNIVLPDMEKGIAWFWAIRRREAPDYLMGLICLYDVEDNNRGFWLAPEYQGQGYMREASIAATDYWFNTLNKPVLRAPKAAVNSAPSVFQPVAACDSSGRIRKSMSAASWTLICGKSPAMSGMPVRSADISHGLSALCQGGRCKYL